MVVKSVSLVELKKQQWAREKGKLVYFVLSLLRPTYFYMFLCCTFCFILLYTTVF